MLGVAEGLVAADFVAEGLVAADSDVEVSVAEVSDVVVVSVLAALAALDVPDVLEDLDLEVVSELVSVLYKRKCSSRSAQGALLF
jgi:hypothetical protein